MKSLQTRAEEEVEIVAVGRGRSKGRDGGFKGSRDRGRRGDDKRGRRNDNRKGSGSSSFKKKKDAGDEFKSKFSGKRRGKSKPDTKGTGGKRRRG